MLNGLAVLLRLLKTLLVSLQLLDVSLCSRHADTRILPPSNNYIPSPVLETNNLSSES